MDNATLMHAAHRHLNAARKEMEQAWQQLTQLNVPAIPEAGQMWAWHSCEKADDAMAKLGLAIRCMEAAMRYLPPELTIRNGEIRILREVNDA